jgi:hypothetical protein
MEEVRLKITIKNRYGKEVLNQNIHPTKSKGAEE